VKRREVSGVLGGISNSDDDINNDNKRKTCRISQLKRKGTKTCLLVYVVKAGDRNIM
jgi:hypothetical protein